MIKSRSKKMVLIKKLISRITFAHILLLAILFLVFFGFYISSPLFRTKIFILGLSKKTKVVGVANFTCTKGKLSEEEYYKKLDELNKQIEQKNNATSKPKSRYFNIDFDKFTPSSNTPEYQKQELEKEGYLRTVKKTINVRRDRLYRFAFKISEKYSYEGDVTNCKCEGKLTNDICEWVPL